MKKGVMSSDFIAILLISIGCILQGCARNAHLLKNGKPNPEFGAPNYRFPSYKKSGHTPPDSVAEYVGGNLKHRTRFYRDANRSVIKIVRYDTANKIIKAATRKIEIDTFPTMEIRKTAGMDGIVREIIASSIKMPENVLIVERYRGSGKFDERVYGVLGPDDLLLALKLQKGEDVDSIVYEYRDGLLAWEYQYRNGKVVAKDSQLMRDERKLLKAVAYTCRNDNCRESRVLEQFYIEADSGK